MKHPLFIILTFFLMASPTNMKGQERQRIDRAQNNTPPGKKNKKAKAKAANHVKENNAKGYLRVDGEYNDFPKDLDCHASSCSFYVSCSESFEIRTLPTWCRLSNHSSGSFRIEFDDNPFVTPRHGYIVVMGGGNSILINLTQAGKQMEEEQHTADYQARSNLRVDMLKRINAANFAGIQRDPGWKVLSSTEQRAVEALFWGYDGKAYTTVQNYYIKREMKIHGDFSSFTDIIIFAEQIKSDMEW